MKKIMFWYDPNGTDVLTSGGLKYNNLLIRAIEASSEEVRIHRFNSSRNRLSIFHELKYSARYISSLRKCSQQSDLLLWLVDSSNSVGGVIHALVARFIYGAKVIVIVHHLFQEDPNKGRFGNLVRKICQYEILIIANQVLTVSQSSCTEIARETNNVGQVTIIDPPLYIDVRNKPIFLFKNFKEQLRIIFVGNCKDPRKRADIAIRTVAKLPKKYNLTLIGSFDEGDMHCRSLISIAESLGVKDRIAFQGRVSEADLITQYLECDVLVMPSDWEGFGSAATEAIFFLMPVIASKVGGLIEAVTDGLSGVLIDAIDAEKIALSILTITKNEEIYNKYRYGCAEDRKRYITSVEFQEKIDVYLKAIVQ